MTGYRILGLVLAVASVGCVATGNWLPAAIAGFIALFCLFGRIDRTVHDVRKDGPRA